MSAETVAATGALIDEHPGLLPVLKEHLHDNDGEVLPHLVMADVMRWLVRNEDVQPEVCRSVLEWMEPRFRRGSDDVRGMLAVSEARRSGTDSDVATQPGKHPATLQRHKLAQGRSGGLLPDSWTLDRWAVWSGSEDRCSCRQPRRIRRSSVARRSGC